MPFSPLPTVPPPAPVPQRGRRNPRRGAGATLALVVAAAGLAVPLVPAAAAGGPTLLSQGKPATASSTQSPTGYQAGEAFDGDGGSRWSSLAADPQWIQVDLGQRASIDRVELDWEGAYGKGYRIQTSDDGSSWTTLSTVTNGDGGADVLDVDGAGRYVRLLGDARGTGYGYSLWEFRVFGEPAGGPVDPTDPTDPNGPTACLTDVTAGATATASSQQGDSTPARAVDQNTSTRWGSVLNTTTWTGQDDEWLQVDLGEANDVCGVSILWEGAYGKDYDVQVSTDGLTWATAAQARGQDGGTDVVTFGTTSARYVRWQGVARGTTFGYSMYELRVLAPGASIDPTTDLLGPNVYVFDPSMPDSAIQHQIDTVFAQQEQDQFGPGRYQFLFTPGEYEVDARIGFYTSLSGVGQDPTDVTVKGGDWVDAQWFGGNATQNFWRSAENLSITPDDGMARWATSQAAPFRRIQVNGGLQLDSSAYGWSSGGYIADSNVTGVVESWTQQQWYARDSSVGEWKGGVWNMVYSGVEGTLPTAATWPTPPVTKLDTTGTVREKPYLYLDGDDWAVFVPELRSGTTGTTWKNGHTAGTSIPLDDFFVAKEGDTAAEINAALDAGKHLLLTPGVYRVDQTIQVDNPGTVVLGLGYATIIPEHGGVGMHVADQDGITVAGILFDAAVTESPALFVVGDEGVHTDHSDDPIVLHDVFMRVGGAVAGKVDAAMIIHADDTIVDHVWSWRGDHGEGIGWDLNTSDYGFVVNGDDVSAYGLFVEHYQKYNTLWNGERGKTVFYQNELPYDVPDQAAWQNGDTRGWAAYKVADDVKNHEAWGLGSYSNFTSDTEETEIVVDGGFEVPQVAGVKMHHLLVVSLGGEGIFDAVINGVGPRADGPDTIPSYVDFYGGVDVAPQASLDVRASAVTRCVAGTVRLAVTATNKEGAPVDVALATPYGATSFSQVAGGRLAAQSFNARAASVSAGSTSVTATGTVAGKPVTTVVPATFDGRTC